MNRPKARGTAAETAVVRAIRPLGFPHAERRALAGTHDLGDIVGTPGICWEVKGGDAARLASDGQIAAWMVETETERINSRADVGILVVQRKGVGAANAHRWWAHLPLRQVAELANGHALTDAYTADLPVRMLLGDLCTLLRDAGYGQPLQTEAVAS
ncbi:hypothetical protein [Nonomuraea sp. NPDC049646]|uniref:hypothetical protein n=1 Tax=unclassified Nonomuraea TaxID=2593643 RepID=UPI0037B89679